MPCYMKKKTECTDNIVKFFGIHETCEEMDKYTCDIMTDCCYWKWSTGDIIGFVILGILILFCIIVTILYYRKYYLK